MRHKHADLIHEWAEGAEIEFYDHSVDQWKPILHPTFGTNCDYRVKPTPEPVRVDWTHEGMDIKDDGYYVTVESYDELLAYAQQVKHNSSVTMDELGEMRYRAEAAESKLAAMKELGENPSDEMRDAGNEVILNRANTLRAWRLMFAKLVEQAKEQLK